MHLKRFLAGIIPDTILLTRCRSAESKGKIALTFDDGPHPEFTPQILDILHSEGATATFFVPGYAAKTHPDIITRIANEGHGIGNHSYSTNSLELCPWKLKLRKSSKHKMS